MIGLAFRAPPDGLTVTSSPSSSTERSSSSSWVNAACSSATSTGPSARPGGLGRDPGRRRVVEGPERRVVALGAVVEAGDVRRSVDQLAGPVAGGQHHGGGAVGDRRHVVAAQRLAQVVAVQQLVDGALAPGADRHLGHRPLVGDAGADHRPGLQGGEGERVGAEGGEVVGVHLHRVDERRVAGGRPARAGDHGDVDVALLQPEPGLVERPGAVHLDVAVPLGRPGADGVEVHDEREGLAGDVVAAAEAGEVDVGPGEAQRGEGVGDDLHQQLDLGLLGVADHRGLRPSPRRRCRSGGDVRHQKIRFTRSGSSMSGSPVGIQPSRLP